MECSFASRADIIISGDNTFLNLVSSGKPEYLRQENFSIISLEISQLTIFAMTRLYGNDLNVIFLFPLPKTLRGQNACSLCLKNTILQKLSVSGSRNGKKWAFTIMTGTTKHGSLQH